MTTPRIRKRKMRGSYVELDTDEFPLPTERDFPALCSWDATPGAPQVLNEDYGRCIVQHCAKWGKIRATARENGPDWEDADPAVKAIEQWVSKTLSFDPECIDEEEFFLIASRVRWLAELLAQHYQSDDSAERKASRLRLKSKRDYYRKLKLAHGVLAHAVRASGVGTLETL